MSGSREIYESPSLNESKSFHYIFFPSTWLTYLHIKKTGVVQRIAYFHSQSQIHHSLKNSDNVFLVMTADSFLTESFDTGKNLPKMIRTISGIFLVIEREREITTYFAFKKFK